MGDDLAKFSRGPSTLDRESRHAESMPGATRVRVGNFLVWTSGARVLSRIGADGAAVRAAARVHRARSAYGGGELLERCHIFSAAARGTENGALRSCWGRAVAGCGGTEQRGCCGESAVAHLAAGPGLDTEKCDRGRLFCRRLRWHGAADLCWDESSGGGEPRG